MKGHTYLFYFLLKVVSIVAVFHQQYDLFVIFSIVVEFHNILMFQLRLYGALLPRIIKLDLVHKLVFLDALLYYSLILEAK